MHKYGAQNIFGRVMTADEVQTINLIDQIESAFLSRMQAKDFVEWQRSHEYKHKLLSWARRCAIELGHDC